ncbi:phospholipase D zeta 1-like protein isoform X1 [Tanacetum coccineum]
MSLYCHRGTNSLTKKYVGPTFRWGLSLGNVLPSSLPHQLFPSDISLGTNFPSDMSLAKGSECCKESVNGQLGQVKLKRAFTKLNVPLLRKLNTLSILRSIGLVLYYKFTLSSAFVWYSHSEVLQGGLDDVGAACVRAIMHWQYRTISRGNSSILHNLSDLLGPRVHDYVSFYGLRAYGRLCDDGLVASSPVYIKLYLLSYFKFQDFSSFTVFVSISQVSLLGLRDSEIGVLIKDKEFVASSIGGNPWKAGKFALSLRLSLWSEHIGLHSNEINNIADLVIDSTYKDIWMATARLRLNLHHVFNGGKLRGHIPGVGPVMPGYVRSRLSYTAPVDRSRDVDFMMNLMRSDNRFADAFARYDSGGASGSGGSRARDREDGDDTGGEDGGDDTIVVSVYRLFPSDMSLGKILPPWHQFLDQKIRGAHFSLGIVAGERFAIELTPSTFPQRHFAGDMFPSDMSLAKRLECCWGKHRML